MDPQALSIELTRQLHSLVGQQAVEILSLQISLKAAQEELNKLRAAERDSAQD